MITYSTDDSTRMDFRYKTNPLDIGRKATFDLTCRTLASLLDRFADIRTALLTVFSMSFNS